MKNSFYPLIVMCWLLIAMVFFLSFKLSEKKKESKELAALLRTSVRQSVQLVDLAKFWKNRSDSLQVIVNQNIQK